MNAFTKRGEIAGPAGLLSVAVDTTPDLPVRGLAVVCHPHPLQGGTMDNKVVTTVARALLQRGWRVVRFNYRGVGKSEGSWDEGRGEVDDALAVIAAHRAAGEPLVLGGFSFGGYVAASAAMKLPEADRPQRLVLVAPATAKYGTPPVVADSLLIHGEADEVVPLQHSLDWARPQALPVVVVPGAGHFFHGQLPLLKALVSRHFAE
ncbi:MAG TPA: alpha/beta fold hydrolase [Burkholderiaceae bacterium]